jgi:hypothetical protein
VEAVDAPYRRRAARFSDWRTVLKSPEVAAIMDELAADPSRFTEVVASGPEDRLLSAIYRAQGFDGLPTVVSADEFDSVLASRPPVPNSERTDGSDHYADIYRGVSMNPEKGPRLAEELRSGSWFAAKGMYGNGSYFGTLATAMEYASGERASVVRASVDPAAKFGELGEVRMLMGREVKNPLSEIRAERDKSGKVVIPLGSEFAEDRRRWAEYLAMADEGRFAAAMGFDAVRVGRGHTVVHNRSALMVTDGREVGNG